MIERRAFLTSLPAIVIGAAHLAATPPPMTLNPAPDRRLSQVVTVSVLNQRLIVRHYWTNGDDGLAAIRAQFELFDELFSREGTIERTQWYLDRDYFDVHMVPEGSRG